MSPFEASIEAAADPLPEGLALVGQYPTFAEGSDHGLVVLAMGLPYWLLPVENYFVLLIERGPEDAVADQLARFDRESVGWPPPPLLVAVHPRPSFFTPLVWALAVMACFWLQQRQPELTRDGNLDATAIFQDGEWWRPATALFLHGDVGHLVSNLVAGVFVFSAVLGALGARAGWLWLALSAIGGNLASAAMHYPGAYHSVGASTAIFAGLGLLTGRALPLARGPDRRRRWTGLLAPLGAGLTLLALYGSGGERVDLGAHLCGFACGLLAGSVHRWRMNAPPVPSPDQPHAP